MLFNNIAYESAWMIQEKQLWYLENLWTNLHKYLYNHDKEMY